MACTHDDTGDCAAKLDDALLETLDLELLIGVHLRLDLRLELLDPLLDLLVKLARGDQERLALGDDRPLQPAEVGKLHLRHLAC